MSISLSSISEQMTGQEVTTDRFCTQYGRRKDTHGKLSTWRPEKQMAQ
jgi:hypothetical protein